MRKEHRKSVVSLLKQLAFTLRKLVEVERNEKTSMDLVIDLKELRGMLREE